MTSEHSDLTRRKFMIVSSAAIASPFVLDMVSSVPAAKAATSSSAKTYYIGHDCMGCQVCRMMCPASAIHYGDDRNEIDQTKCIHCGTCYKNCPVSVISEC
jgi:ferredoxin